MNLNFLKLIPVEKVKKYPHKLKADYRQPAVWA